MNAVVQVMQNFLLSKGFRTATVAGENQLTENKKNIRRAWIVCQCQANQIFESISRVLSRKINNAPRSWLATLADGAGTKLFFSTQRTRGGQPSFFSKRNKDFSLNHIFLFLFCWCGYC
jgi:hypothetical protein